MSEHVGYVQQLTQLRPHSNADRLQVATFFGNDTIVDLSMKIGDWGIYFPSDLQLSVEYCAENNLVRKKDDAGNNIGGYLDPDKRNIRPIKLRGEISDGLFMPIYSLEYTGIDISTLKVGDTIDVVNGHEICRKYIPRGNNKTCAVAGTGNRTRKKKIPIAPLFTEHADTEQLAYHLDAFKPGDLVEITLKMHGTSQRTGYLPVFQKYKRTLLDRILRKEGTPIYNWGYVSGTRRTVLENYEGGYYGSNEFRESHSKFFEGKLHKGEEVYYEVVGFTTSGSPIMSDADNNKTNDKKFIKKYGATTRFSYGCNPTGKEKEYYKDENGVYCLEKEVPQSKAYVYRMTMTNEDGDIVEYSPDFMRYRCEQMGIDCVPVLWKGFVPESCKFAEPDDPFSEFLPAGEYIKNIAEQYYDGPDPIGKTHVREGVVCRIVNRPKFTAYKHKNFYFKCLEGIIKDSSEAPDIEEAQEVENNGTL